MKRIVAALTLLMLVGCGPSLDEQRAENRVKDAIAPGLYSNVLIHEETGDQLGLMLSLPRGSDSATAQFTSCDGACGPAQTVTVRRGLNGIFFELPGDGQGRMPALVAVEPAQGGVTLRADWGHGLEEHALPRAATTDHGAPART